MISFQFNSTTKIKATISIGVSSYPRDGETADFLIRAADAALYEAKKTGRNRVVAAKEKHEVYSIASKINNAIETTAWSLPIRSLSILKQDKPLPKKHWQE